ncbi:hypothetical protein niasHS_000222 [Heterodera schachtii]|uniref:Uncharacterized protein n=1 Tax=Heterodera schachtii TaxID=97005 RepID=A0ABD2KBK7_HETSC
MVLDDLMVGMGQQFLDTVFTRGSHNWGVSVVLVTQHLFAKELRVARNNSHYLVLMRNPAGALQVRTLASQLFPTKSNYFTEAYRDATEKQFGYLLIDMHPESPELLRLKTNIYGEQGGKLQIQRLGALKHHLRRLARARCAKTARRVLLLNRQNQHHQTGAGFPVMASMLTSILLPLLMDKLLPKRD